MKVIDSQALSPKTCMIIDLQKQVQNLNIRVGQNASSDYGKGEGRKEIKKS